MTLSPGSFGGMSDVGGMVVQASGDIVVAGGIYDRSGGWASLGLARFLPSGQLDSSFGSGGVMVDSGYGVARAVAQQPDGGLLVASGSGLGVVRLDVDGRLDTSFGTNGQASVPNSAATTTRSIAVESNGDIVVGGRNTDAQGNFEAEVVRYLPTGQLDSSFADNGVYVSTVASDVSTVLPEAGGIIVVSGGTNGVVFRLTESGAIDTSFGASGVASGASPEPTAGALQSDGSIVTTGETASSPYSFWVGRYTSSGSVDSSFGSNGIVQIPALRSSGALHDPSGFGTSIAVQPDGKLVVAGYNDDGTPGAADFEIVRLLPDGAFDSSFGTNGRAFIWPSPAGQTFSGSPKQLLLDASGNILTVGHESGNGVGWLGLGRTLGNASAGTTEAAPDTTITSSPQSGTTATYTFTASEPGTFQCELDNTGWTPCSSPQTYTGNSGHQFYVRAVNTSGNVDLSPAASTWTPETTITSGPSSSTTSTSATFAFSSSFDGSIFYCSLDGAATTVCSSPTTYSGLASGPHTFSVAASYGTTDPTPATATWTITTSTPTPPPPTGPANDMFANAQTITGTTGSTSGSTVSATHETGEPYNAGIVGGHSIWYRWTTTSSGTATIDTFGSGFDTTLGAYTGTTVSALASLASDDDAGGTTQSQITFPVNAGTTYTIAVDGYSTAAGTVHLDWQTATSTPQPPAPPPPSNAPSNDMFANAQTLSGTRGSSTGTNIAATKEPGEPNHAGNSGGHSVWYRWTAPSSGTATIDLAGSNFDTLLGVYRGTSVNGLSQVAANDDAGGGTVTSRVRFSAHAGTTYTIAIDGYGGATGTVTVAWHY